MMSTIFITSLHPFKKVKYLKSAIIGFSLIKIARKLWIFDSIKNYFAEDYVLVNLDYMTFDLKDIFKNTPHMA